MTDHRPGEPPGKFADRLLSLDDLGRLREPPPLYRAADGRPLLYRGTLAQLSGGYGTYKSFIAIDAACTVASGIATGRAEGVVFIAAEGATGLRKRILAWCQVHRVDPTDLSAHLRVHSGAIQLSSTVDMGEVKAHCIEHRPALLIVDTRAKCSIGIEENDSTKQGPLIRAVEGIVDDSGVTALVIHHTGKNGSDRGTNAWPAGVWSHLTLTKGKKEFTASIECDKHKDAASGCKHQLQLVRHQLPETAVPPRRPDETSADYAERRYTLAVTGAAERSPARTMEDRVADLDATLDRLEVPRSAGAPTVRNALRAAGVSAPNDVIAAVVKDRRSHPAELSVENCPPDSSTDSGQRADSPTSPQVVTVRDTDGQLRTGPCPSVSPSLEGDGQGGQSDSGQWDGVLGQVDHAAAHSGHDDERTAESGIIPGFGRSLPEGKRSSEPEPQGEGGEVLAAACSEARQGTQPHDEQPITSPADTITTEPHGPGNEETATAAAESGNGDVEEPDSAPAVESATGAKVSCAKWLDVHLAQLLDDGTETIYADQVNLAAAAHGYTPRSVAVAASGHPRIHDRRREGNRTAWFLTAAAAAASTAPTRPGRMFGGDYLARVAPDGRAVPVAEVRAAAERAGHRWDACRKPDGRVTVTVAGPKSTWALATDTRRTA